MKSTTALFAICLGAASAQNPLEQRVEELERTVEALTEALEHQEMPSLFQEVGESEFGFAPAASKVYQSTGGLSIGGYGEGFYQHQEDGTDNADLLRGVLYFGYKYTEKWIFNSEIEFEHASTSKEGSASVEFATIDHLASDALGLRVGLLLVPMGLLNKLHEPTTFLSVGRPETERRIIPSTWRENGLGIFGEAGGFEYEAYVLNGLKGEKFDDNGFRGGRQKGSQAVAEDLAGVLRLDYTGTPGLLVGGSAYHGDSGQDSGLDLDTTLVEAHAETRWRGLRLRGLAAVGSLDGATELNAFRAEKAEVEVDEIAPVGERLFGWYIELGYDVFNGLDLGEQSLTPFVRYEELNTQDEVPDGARRDGSRDREFVTIGLAYQPLDELIFKADYVIRDAAEGDPGNVLNLGLGYVF